MNAVDLIRRVQDLISEYGSDSIINAVALINSMPKAMSWPGKVFVMNSFDFNRIGDHVRRGEKITAIKLFREITACGLKEAKDAVEGTDW